MSFFLWYVGLPTVPVAVGMWLVVLRVLSRKSGWNDLAEAYGDVPSGAFEGRTLWFSVVYVGEARYSSAAVLSALDEGLALRTWGPFSPWHAPFYIPADEMDCERVNAVRADSGAIIVEGDFVKVVPDSVSRVPVYVSVKAMRQLGLLGKT